MSRSNDFTDSSFNQLSGSFGRPVRFRNKNREADAKVYEHNFEFSFENSSNQFENRVQLNCLFAELTVNVTLQIGNGSRFADFYSRVTLIPYIG